MAKTKATPKAAEPKKTAAKTTKAVGTKQTKPTEQKKVYSHESLAELKVLTDMHPTASVSLLKAMTNNAEVKELLDLCEEKGIDHIEVILGEAEA
jgi:hypothetical protein